MVLNGRATTVVTHLKITSLDNYEVQGPKTTKAVPYYHSISTGSSTPNKKGNAQLAIPLL